MNPHLFLWHCIYKGLHNSFKKWLLTPLGGSAQYDTPGRLTLRSMRPQGDFVWKTWLTWRNLTKIENILTHCSDEKNGGRKLVWPRGQRQPYCCICAAHFDLFSLSAVGVVALPPPPSVQLEVGACGLAVAGCAEEASQTRDSVPMPEYLTPWRFLKIRITRRNINQNQKYFYQLVSGPGRFKLWRRRKTGGWKSRWTVPF